jgi:Holliday junction DNA helicase RuvA
MIAKLKGTVDEMYLDSLILDIQGVGYLVYATEAMLKQLPVQQELSLYIYQTIRETANDLYGFLTIEEKNFFELLLSVSGIGPKSALGVLNTAPLQTLQEGIAMGDPSHLTAVSGIGKKSAEKIVVTLKDKLALVVNNQAYVSGGTSETLEALTSLGYSASEARAVIQTLDSSLSTEEMIKAALKKMGTK